MRIFNLSGQNETIRNFKVISSRDGNVIFGERRKRRKKGKIIFFFLVQLIIIFISLK